MHNSDSKHEYDGTEIAIIGMSCRFPGAGSVEEFWSNLRRGVESISFFPDVELERSLIEPVAADDPYLVKAGGLLDGVDLFDAAFFNFSPGEALVMDPQQRLFMECAWEALEDAGYGAIDEENAIGVFAGATASTYLLNLYSNDDIFRSIGAAQIGVGNNLDFLTSGVSYKLGLKGPSYTVLTACSTSLVAVHLACQSLLDQECDMALAGGASIRIPQRTGYRYQEGGILSPDGHCRAFDADARGTVFGNGVGVIILKRLEPALTDGDNVLAIIKGTAINNDGSLKVGFTAPSVEGQTEVIVEALSNAGAGAETIGYIETHGTATALGDPIEIEALKQAFQDCRKTIGSCAIGSVKTNIGHLDAAAGIAGLIKTVLMLKNKMLVPSLHYVEPNPRINFEDSPFYVNTELRPWKRNQSPRRAGVSSFGIGGTNAHAILEESVKETASGAGRAWQLLLLSARTQDALERATLSLNEHLRRHEDLNLADVAFTLQVGRKQFGHRCAVICRDIEGARKALSDPRSASAGFHAGGHRPVVFMFPGQGTQYVNMGREIYETEPLFGDEVNYCAALLEGSLGFDIREVLFPNGEQTEAAGALLDQTQITQPALFVIEYALAKLLLKCGLEAEAFIGHSLGEYVAACLSGVMTVEEALRLIVARARLMQQLTGGMMLSVELSESELLPRLGSHLSLAAVNNPKQCVVSGVEEAVLSLQRELLEEGVSCLRLRTSHAFHSRMIEQIIEPLIAVFKHAQLRPPDIPFLSNVTGDWITDEDATDPLYWVAHTRKCVRFGDGIKEILKEPRQLLLEVGPKQVLGTIVRQHAAMEGKQVTVVSTLRDRETSDRSAESLLKALGALWVSGAQIDWREYHARDRRRRVPLPTYPFERRRHWVEPNHHLGNNLAKGAEGLKRQDIKDWFYIPSWRRAVPMLSPGDKFRAQAQDTCWLVFADESGLAAQIIRRLREEGQRVISVRVARQFTKQNETNYTLSPAQFDHYNSLLKELRECKNTPERILHLWSASAGAEHATKYSHPNEDVIDRGFYSLLHLAQAIAEQHYIDPISIAVVSTEMHEVVGEEACAEKAMLLGPCKVIPQELTNITCKSIDVMLAEAIGEESAELVEQLLAEAAYDFDGISFEPVISYRGKQRWVQTCEPLKIDLVPASTDGLRNEGTYLITGGLGRFGLTIAKYLARQTRARLILTGRSSLPERELWGEWLALHSENDPFSIKIKRVMELESLGAEVIIGKADAEDKEQMLKLVAQAYERYGEINGIVHAAGVAGDEAYKPIQEISRVDCERIFRSKVNGTLVIHEIFQGRKLDFCLLVSSLSPILGGLGLVAYSAANLYMDSFNQYARRCGSAYWKSINWEGWSRQNDHDFPTSLGTQITRLIMSDGEVERCFQQVLTMNSIGQVVIATGDLHSRIDQWVRLEGIHRPKTSLWDSKSLSDYARSRQGETFVAPSNEAETKIAEAASSILQIEAISVHDSFFDLGGTSLMAVQFISRLRESFQLHLPLRTLFENPTVAALAQAIRELSHTEEQSREEIARILEEVEKLSEDELKERIAEELKTLGESTT
jgi:acyl transferase domain-containing protein/acyl carrier protein